MDLKVAVVIFQIFADGTVHRKSFASLLGCWDGKPLAFDVEDFLLVLPAVERCLVKVNDRRSVRDVLGQLVGELDSLRLQQS